MAPEDREREGDEWCVVKMEIANLENEIARLRADVERKDEALREAAKLAWCVMAYFDVYYGSDERQLTESATYQQAKRGHDKITAALADTANPKEHA